MTRGADESTADRAVAVFGDDDAHDRVVAELDEVDGIDVVRAAADPTRSLSGDPSAVVVDGVDALSALVCRESDRGDDATSNTASGAFPPVIVLNGGTDVPSIPETDLPATLDVVFERAAETEYHRPVTVEVDDVSVTGLFDVAMVVDEPATISAFEIRAGDSKLATLRADGVVVATAAGSRRYANRIGVPQLSSTVDGVAVAPIAQFSIEKRHWIVDERELRLRVVRDGAPVSVQVDGRVVTTVDSGTSVTVARESEVSLVRPIDGGN